MLRDLRVVFQLKSILLILAASITLRLFIFFFVLPSSPSRFGPDEGTYASLAKFVSRGTSVTDFPAYGAGLYNSARSIILPSVLFIKIGINELDAVRITSSIYGTASILFFSLIVVAYYDIKFKSVLIIKESFNRKTILLIGLFAFLPSNFIWSTIGLRESGSQFWLIASFYMLLKLSFSRGGKMWIYAPLSVLSVSLGYGTRPETALIFSSVALLSSLVFLIKYRNPVVVLVLVLGIILGHKYSSTPNLDVAGNADVAGKADVAGNADVVRVLKQQISKVELLEYKRNVNALDAESALPKSSCLKPNMELLQVMKCNAVELPYRVFAFLFRPLLFFDQGSLTMTLAAFENIVWSLLILSGFFKAFRRSKSYFDNYLNCSLVGFILMFTLTAALYEGNLGTAFRHKSSILWSLMMILVASDLSKPPKKQKEFSLI